MAFWSNYISLFQSILNRKHVRQLFSFPNSAVGFNQTHFCWPYQFHGGTKISENTIPDHPPNWIRSFFEVYTYQMHCFIIFPLFSSIWQMQDVWSVIDLLRKKNPYWSPIIFSAYGVNLDTRMLDKILYTTVTMAWHIMLQMEEQPPVWRVAANILNKQLWTVDKEWFSSLGFRWGANNSSP